MKISITFKLVISYIILITLVVVTLIFVTQNVFINEFNSYVELNQDKKAESVIDETQNLLESNSNPTHNDFYAIATNAYKNGITYLYNDVNGNIIFDINDNDRGNHEKHFDDVDSNMKKYYKNFDGDVVEKSYDIVIDGKKVGTLTLGFYQPFYYGEHEIGLVNTITKNYISVGVIMLLIAIILGIIFAKTIADPLKIVSNTTMEMRDGNYKKKIFTTSNTKEVSQLVDSINSLNKSLDNQEKIKKQMAENYAHEIRTPLTSISSTLEGVKDNIITLDENRIDNLIKEVDRLTSIVANLDKISRNDSNSNDIVRSKVNLVKLVSEVISVLDSDYKQKNIIISIKNNLNEYETINVDEEKIKSVVFNLLSNACKYTDEGGSVVVELNYNQRHEISVIDTGIGIDKSEIEHIFEHLYRVDKSRVKSVEGYGVGLSIVKDIVEAHSGEIIVSSVVGEGSEFKIIL